MHNLTALQELGDASAYQEARRIHAGTDNRDGRTDDSNAYC